MDRVRIAAVLLILAGTLGLVYGGFSYTKESHDTRLGPLEMTFKEKQRVTIPAWAGAGAIAAGTLLLLLRKKS
jgi:hypothetical protein